MNKHLLARVTPVVLAIAAGMTAAPALSMSPSLIEGTGSGFSVASNSLAHSRYVPLSSDVAHEMFSLSHLTERAKTESIANETRFNVGQAGTPSGAGSIIAVNPPRVADYWVSVSRQDSGVLVFDGYAPDEATKSAFGDIDGADVNFLKLGQGAPASYGSSVEFGIALLSHLSEGRFSLRANALSLTGIARSSRDFALVHALLEGELPDGLTRGQIDYEAPRASTYQTTLQRQPNGTVLISGLLPSPQIERDLASELGGEITADVTYASGEPLNFAASIEQAADILPLLAEGEIRFDGSSWAVSGTAASADDKAALDTEFATRGLAQSGWTLDVAEPALAQSAAVATPYTWSAARRDDGGVTLTGSVPARTTQQFFAVRFPADIQDDTAIRNNAPAGFSQNVLVALDIVALLAEGQVDFDGTSWSASGATVTATGPDEIAALVATSDPAWRLQIQPPAVAQVATTPEQQIEPATPDEPAAPTEPAIAAEPEPAAVAQPESAPAEVAPRTVAADPAALALCREQVAELTAHNAILFQSGAAIIAESAGTELDAFATVLSGCPNTKVYIEGHTDSDGDAQKNLALSVARAESVVNALIQRGIAAERLYAVGYGESQPIADNATSDGKRQNRRIIVTVQTED